MSQSGRVAKNIGATILNQLFSWALTLYAMQLTAQYLGASGLGRLTLALSVSCFCGLMVNLGTSTVLIREIARDHSRLPVMVVSALAMRVLLCFGAVAIVTAFAYSQHYAWFDIKLIIIGGFAIGYSQLNDVFSAALTGLEQMTKQSLSQFVQNVIFVGGTILLIKMREPMWTLIGIQFVSNTVLLAVNLNYLRPHFTRFEWPSRRTVTDLAVSGLPFLSMAVFIMIYGQADPIILKRISGFEAIGWYGLASRLRGTLLFIPVAITSALLPTLSRVSRDDPDAFVPMVRRVVNFVLIAAVPFASVLIFSPHQILRILHFPDSFGPSEPVLMIIGAGIVIWYVSQVVGYSLIASDRQASLSRITGIAAAISIPLCIGCVYLGQHFLHNGAIGAATADVVVESYLLVSYLRALGVQLINWTSLETMIRATGAALPLILVLYYVQDNAELLNVIASGILGAIAYLPLCWLLRVLQPQDLSAMRQMIARRRGTV